MNTFTKFPKRSDIWLREVATKKDLFIVFATLDLPALNADKYEVLGVVAHADKDGILVVYKENHSGKVWCNRPWWYLTGYTLDGTDRSGVLSIRVSSDNWAANVDKTISYNATTMEDFVTQLNAAFAADSDFTADDWEASIIDGKVRLSQSAPWQAFVYDSGKNGFNIGTSCPEIGISSNMLRKNGHYSGDWAISNMDKAIQHLRADNVGWKPTSPVKTYKSQQPLCLPVYLGTSTAVAGDMCEYIRGIFGEGEEGWLNYLRCCEPVWDTQMGTFAEEDGRRISTILGGMRFNSPKVTDGHASPMMDYINGISTRTIAAGELYCPSAKQLGRILYGVKYGTSAARNSDILNDALSRINGVGIKNNAYWWSCCRVTSHNSWYSHGNYGVFYSNVVSGSYGVLPVLHLKVA